MYSTGLSYLLLQSLGCFWYPSDIHRNHQPQHRICPHWEFSRLLRLLLSSDWYVPWKYSAIDSVHPCASSLDASAYLDTILSVHFSSFSTYFFRSQFPTYVSTTHSSTLLCRRPYAHVGINSPSLARRSSYCPQTYQIWHLFYDLASNLLAVCKLFVSL